VEGAAIAGSRIVGYLAAAGVWRTGPSEFVAHVIKSEFGNVSSFLKAQVHPRADPGAWRVTRESEPRNHCQSKDRE